MSLTEKAAYIKGLAEGLQLNKDTAEGKLIAALIDIVSDLTNAQSETDEDLSYLNDYIEELDEDLGALEEEVYDIDEDECDDDCCDCCDCCDDDDEDGFEVTCPACGETIVFDDINDDDDLVCPNCHEKIIYEFNNDEE